MNFKPAMPSGDEAPQQLTVVDFQKHLFEWYKKRGLLNELRAHLRTQMVSALKDTPVHQCFTSKNISPKMQAFNLLVAEFLMLYNYHYSLSVFSTEVPFTNVFHNFNSDNSQQDKAFDENNAVDILETVGISQHSRIGSAILKKYLSNTAEPLLIYILRSLSSKLESIPLNIIQTKIAELGKNLDNNNTWQDDFKNFFVNHDIDEASLEIVISFMNDLLCKEKEICNSKIENLKKEFQEKEAHLLKGLSEERSKWESEFKALKQRLNLVRQKELQTLHKHITHLSDFEKKLNKQQDDVVKQKKEVEEDKKRLETSLKILNKEKMIVMDLKERLTEEKKTIVKFRKILEKEKLPNSTETVLDAVTPQNAEIDRVNNNSKIKLQSNKLTTKVEPNENNLKNNTACSNKINTDNNQKIIHNLQMENKKMQIKIHKQKAKIQELSSKISNIILNTKNIPNISNIPSNNGEKEREAVEKKIESIYVNKISLSKYSEDENVSEDVVKEARQYLEQIKNDSKNMNNYYKELQTVLSTAEQMNK